MENADTKRKSINDFLLKKVELKSRRGVHKTLNRPMKKMVMYIYLYVSNRYPVHGGMA